MNDLDLTFLEVVQGHVNQN